MHRISIDASNICSRIKYLLMHQISCDDHVVNGDYVVSSPDTVCSYREAHGPQGSWSKKVWEPLLYRELHVTCALVQPPRDKSSLNWKTLHCALCQSVIINREMGPSEREREREKVTMTIIILSPILIIIFYTYYIIFSWLILNKIGY